MRIRAMELNRFRSKPVMGILRDVEKAQLKPLIDALVQAGLETIEITMNTPQAPLLIRLAAQYSRGRLAVGAGTVLGMRDLQRALRAGSSFIVMPVAVKEVMEYCRKNRIAVFPGALTPQEIYRAWEAGADMVKVFPANLFGPGYFRQLRGPFKDIPLLACGGVTPSNIKEYFLSGASAVAFGSEVFKKEWLRAGDYARIAERIKKYLKELVKVRPGKDCAKDACGS